MIDDLTLKMAVLSSQTIHACFAVAFRTQASTRFVTGEYDIPFIPKSRSPQYRTYGNTLLRVAVGGEKLSYWVAILRNSCIIFFILLCSSCDQWIINQFINVFHPLARKLSHKSRSCVKRSFLPVCSLHCVPPRTTKMRLMGGGGCLEN